MIIYGASLDAALHTHQAIQVIWPKSDSLCLINGNNITQPVIINSKIPHQLKMTEGWVLLIEPKSHLGEALYLILQTQDYKVFEVPYFTSCHENKSENDLKINLKPLFKNLNLPIRVLFNNHSTVIDKRIQQIISQLDECLKNDCIKPATWRASEVADQLALSQSRFLHLFSQELGISWRPYLLWRRMMCAITAILKKSSATEAAYKAGFSDSAHLSRTFKNMFGMTIKQARIIFKR
ncbi:helix-turn-helix domain-containing protein [Pseudoalteromonas sp. NBT06-2]|uniref:helix-turn-helix domain-containing protein n=1 Tax=Pseudoalteromonas sp. NBT06-2 TaxID=2025950 RepID=UPI0020752708|nr:helix-turn-helix domain-containing protein [Pseudoalteromonas sp. NBT06-2]